jgi:DNA-binding transcriptional LysR family regulator
MPIQSIDLKSIRYFIMSAELGSLRHAADSLKVRESTVSRRVRDLEDEIGASLFIRHPGGVSLTLAGQRFLHRARRAVEQLSAGAIEVHDIGRSQSGILRIGLFSSLTSGYLSKLINSYDDKFTGVHIDFVDAPARQHSISISRFEIDVAFTIGRLHVSGCEALYLWSEGVFVAISETHPLSSQRDVKWTDVSAETFLVRPGGSGAEVQEYIESKFSNFSDKPRINTQNVGRYSLLGLVSAGRGIALAIQSETRISV